MQEYRRQIAYLYAYEHGQKTHNYGFTKIENCGNNCSLEIHLKSYCYPDEDTGKAYIYYYYRGRIIGICLGDLTRQNGMLEWRGQIDPHNVLGKGILIPDTRGIWITRPGNRNYVAQWDDYPVDISRFIRYPRGGERCIRCPRFGNCERSMEHAVDR